MECKCKIKTVLEPREVEFLKNLFKCTGRDEPKVKGLAVLEDSMKPTHCQFAYSWGFSNYCANPEIIEEFLKNNK